MCCYASPDPAEAAEALRPFRALAPVASDGIGVMPYAEVLEDMTPLPPGLRMEVRNAFFSALDDARIAAVDDLFAGGGAALALRSMGGAAARVSRDATAFAHRDAEVMLAAAFLQAAPARDVPFPVGARVASDRWGQGTVQRYDGDQITVLFDEHGYRELFVPVVLERGLLRSA